MSATTTEAPAAAKPRTASRRAPRGTCVPAAKAEGDRKAATPSKASQRGRDLGRKGEEAAAKYLAYRGYDILERNWSCFAGEADIIARDGQWLVFVEVKTRRNTDRGFPSEAVDRRKRQRYEKIALAYAQQFDATDVPVRFDVVSIVVIAKDKAMIRHQLNAFSG